jgi:hypothetical protein
MRRGQGGGKFPPLQIFFQPKNNIFFFLIAELTVAAENAQRQLSRPKPN